MPNGSAVVSIMVPPTVVAGASFVATIRMKNTGTLPWSELAVDKGSYRLGTQEPQDTFRWRPNRVRLPVGTTVLPGQEVTFTADLLAPGTLGAQACAWRMVQDYVEWFGPIARAMVTVVAAPAGTPVPPPPVPVPVAPIEARVGALENTCVNVVGTLTALATTDKDLGALLVAYEARITKLEDALAKVKAAL